MPRHLLRFVVLFCLPFMFTCNQQDGELKPMPESAKAYLLAYSEGVIARQDPIDIQFAGLVISAEEVGKEVDVKTANIRPNVAGKWTWTDRQSMRFTPDEMLDFSTRYIVSIRLNDLFDNVPQEAETFEFTVETRDPFVSVQLEGLHTPDINERNKQVLKGRLISSDHISDVKVKDMLKAEQEGTTLPITWSSNAAGTQHFFTINNVARDDQARSLTINWNGAAIGAGQKGQESVEIPAIGDFKVLKVETFGGTESYADIYFSDPLDEQQQFTGLVSVADYSGALRYKAAGHVLKVYFDSSIGGERKLTAFTGIKNLYRESMPRTSIWEVNFSAAQPEVKLLGNGNILPTTGKLVFPFEAIGLHTVEVEVFKIYSNNILQFFQTNSFNGRDEMTRVGKVVLREEVPLTEVNPMADQSNWSRYALDLQQFFTADPKAIYQVRIGFRPTHSTMSCPQEQSFDFTNRSSRSSEEDLMSSWYGIEGYYREYRWDQRDDPCFPAYYNSDRFIARNILTSNLGLVVKGGPDNQYHATITELKSAKPLGGVELKYYDFQQQLIGTALSNGDGFATIELTDPPFMVVAETASDQAYLRLQDGEALSLSRFDVSGATTQDGLKGFIYGERGVWRPGDSVFLNFILEDEQGLLPPNYPVSFELRDAQGQMVLQRSGIVPTGMIYPMHFATNRSDPTGLWQLKVLVGNATFNENIRIETVKPNRIKMDLIFADDPIRLASGDAKIKLEAAWLHGALAKNLKANVEATTSLNNAGFEQFSGYSFTGRNTNNFARNQVVFDGNTDDNGEAQFQLKLPNQQQAAGPLLMSLRTRVYERGGNFSTDNQRVEIHPFDNYAGVAAPLNRYGTPRITIGEESSVGLAAVNYSGKAVSGRQLTAKLYRVEWRWWWDDINSSHRSGYNRERTQRLIAETEKTSNAQGRANWAVKVEEWGRYLIRVCDKVSGHCAETYVYAGSPWYNERNFSEEATILTFQAEREDYKVGEDIQLTFPAGSSGRALLSLENGSGVLEEHWINTKAGDNVYSFKATKEMSPTVYASLTVLQPYEQDENDMPLRAYGVIPISIVDPSTELQPNLKVADELAPEQNFAVEVTEADGRPMTYTLAIVDEGLLSLTRFKTPNPHEIFYAREALGVQTWDMYNYVLGRHFTQLDKILSIGGDGDFGSPKEAKRANRFEPVVMHLGPFELEKNGKAKHSIEMPNYIGAVRVMVVGATKHTAYGAAEKTVPVRKPLMVLATLPRVLGIGESLELPVNVFAMKDGLGKITVRLEETSGIISLAESEKEVSLTKTGDELVRFSLNVGNAVGIAKFKVIAEGGGERASQEIEIDVRNPNPVQTLTDRYVLNPGEEHNLTYEPFGSTGTRSGSLEVTNLPPLDLERRMNYLLRYPYGCLEQTLSAGFPQLHLATFMKLSEEEEKKTRENVSATLQRLRRFQLPNGGFSYWPGQSGVASWSTNYAGHFILAAKQAGYTVANGMLENWIAFQKQSARKWDGQIAELGHVSRRSYELDQAYRLYTLALAGKPEMGAMNRLREQPQLNNTSKWRLAAAYALAGQTKIAEDLIARLNTEVDSYRELSYTFGSAIRDKAMILETLVLLGKNKEADQLVLLLSSALSSQRWLSTHEIAYSLLALSKYVGENETLSNTYTFTVQQSGSSAVDVGADHPYMLIELDDRAGEVRIKNTSQQKLFANIIRNGQPLPSAEQAVSNLINLTVRYMDGSGNTIDVSSLSQGTDFMAEVSVKHPGVLNYSYKELALEQIFPAGWEITNTRFENINSQSESAYTYRDFRDDRVHTFFDLGGNSTNVFKVYLSATYAGRYYLPATSCGAMYDNKIYAASPGFWVDVIRGEVE